MKKYIAISLILCSNFCFAGVYTGEIEKQGQVDSHTVYDMETNVPLEGVVIKIPAKNYKTKTNKNGVFVLNTDINSPTIMSVEKMGYKPYSMTIKDGAKSPIQVGIEKTSSHDIVVDTNMIHIGDDSFSKNSANASEFSLLSAGPFYSKDFKIPNIKPQEALFLVIGSIIGIDTVFAQQMGQSRVTTAYSNPPEIFFNGNKISDIKINGDNQKIKIPTSLIKFNQNNNVTIKTGRNLFKTTDIDFDDIEFTNLLFEIR